MALDTTIITSAFAHIRANPSMPQTDQETYIANAIKQFVLGLQITYTTGLADSSGPVTGAFGNTLN
jgi:hypothetical protein